MGTAWGHRCEGPRRKKGPKVPVYGGCRDIPFKGVKLGVGRWKHTDIICGKKKGHWVQAETISYIQRHTREDNTVS